MSLRLHAPRTPSRRGSTLIIVIALLASLMLLGFLFLTISSQEQANAYLFSEGAKVPQYAGSDYFDFALEQLILGARDDYYNSALWGGRASLLPTMFGNDLQPFNGPGVNLSWDNSANVAVVDQEFNGTQDDPPSGFAWDAIDDDLISINLSPAAWLPVDPDHLTTLASTPGGMTNMPAADVEYTAPDLASPFLTYVSYEPTTGQRIVIPAFHRPQYLRDTGVAPGDWYTDAATARRTMRPHAAHVAVTEAGNDSGHTRFISSGANAFPFTGTIESTSQARDEGVWWNSTNTPVFSADADNDGLYESDYIDLNYPEQVSADGDKTFVPLFAFTVYDADGLFNLNAHGNAYGNIAMYDGSGNPLPFGDGGTALGGDGAVEVGIDAGGVAKNDYISRSNQGNGPGEINPQVGLDAPSPGTVIQPFGHAPANALELANMEWWFILAGYVSVDTSTGDATVFAGRWGESQRTRAGALRAMGGTAAEKATATKFYPYPGGSQIDDQTPAGASGGGDALAGTGATGTPPGVFDATGSVFPPAMAMLPNGQPLDVRGQGRFVLRTAGGKERWFYTGADAAPFRLPYYADYADYGTSVAGEPTWRNHLGGDVLVGTPPWLAHYSTGTRQRIDLVDETTLDPKATSGGQDAIFSPGESATMQFSKSDGEKALKFSQRLLTLAPNNFDGDLNPAAAQARRKMYATYSADTKTAGKPVYNPDPAVLGERAREWETSPDPTLGTRAFPPYFPGIPEVNQPFRYEVRALLRDAPGQVNAQTLLRKLSVNHVAEQVTHRPQALGPTDPGDASYEQGLPANMQRVRLRPLTPHPVSGLGSTPVPVIMPSFGMRDIDLPLKTWQIANAAQQEWHARRDRQNLARDIYVLLYTMGKADTSTDFNPIECDNEIDWSTGEGTFIRLDDGTVGPPGSGYSLRELREMAQFAVNLVDALDEDDTITCFVYDLNLADGYTDRDDGYSDPVPWDETLKDYIDTTEERGMVYGVETQSLTLSEGLFVLAKRSKDGDDNPEEHELTEWDDRQSRDFSYVELMNVGPKSVEFNENWQIVLRPVDPAAPDPMDPDPPEPPTIEVAPRGLTLTADAEPVGVGTNAVYGIAAAGDNHNEVRLNSTDPFPGTGTTYWSRLPSRMRVNIDESRDATSSFPADGTLEDEHWKTIVPPSDMPDAQNRIRLDLLETTGAAPYRIFEMSTDPEKPWLDGNEVQAGQPADMKTGEWLQLITIDGGADRDAVFDDLPEGTASGVTIRVELRRRLNLRRDPVDTTDELQSQDNPWIVVDEMDVDLSVFNPSSLDNPQFIEAVRDQILSTERTEPLLASSQELYIPSGGTAPPFVASNSIGDFSPELRDVSEGLWQPHYDRPFASLGEVLGVPLYGPRELTQRLGDSSGILLRGNVAAARVLFPDGDAVAPAAGMYDNLWYRVFEFLHVPEADGGKPNYGDSPWFTVDGGFPFVNDRVRRLSDDVAGPNQRFGKLNLNTIRHPHVYAGMLDDFSVMARPIGQEPPTSVPNISDPAWQSFWMRTQSSETLDIALPDGVSDRRWWIDFLVSRDGIDPYTGLVLPGLAVGRSPDGTNILGRPFRSSSMALRVDAGGTFSPGLSIEDTIFRRLPGSDLPTHLANVRGLFELGDAGEPDNAAFDYTVRYRLLSKVLNHSTTRSNVFLVFIDVKYFNATVDYTDDGEKFVQIGAPDTDANQNSPRAFFVIDRTQALETIAAKDLPQNNQYIRPGASRPLITSSFARNPDGTPTFNWRDLVLSSVRID